MQVRITIISSLDTLAPHSLLTIYIFAARRKVIPAKYNQVMVTASWGITVGHPVYIISYYSKVPNSSPHTLIHFRKIFRTPILIRIPGLLIFQLLSSYIL